MPPMTERERLIANPAQMRTTEIYQDVVITEDSENKDYFVKLTTEQYRLLEWLRKNNLLSSYVRYKVC